MEQSNLVDNIQDTLERYLNQAGLYYRIFGRRKSDLSIRKKMSSKKAVYEQSGRKMQDFVGIRIVFYFQDDVEIFHEKLKTLPGYDSANESNTATDIDRISALKDEIDRHEVLKPLSQFMPLHDKVFMPQRLNLVMKMPKSISREMENEISNDILKEFGHLIDDTYEVQLRTVLSEGWHEVEHDLRYKTQNETWWNDCKGESRQLNGIYASLEASESALSNMISNIAYKNYKSHAWDAMIRNHFCLRFNEAKLSDYYVRLFDANPRLAKSLFQIDRKDMINWLWQLNTKVSLTTDLVLCLANRKSINNSDITENEPMPVKLILNA